MPSTWRIHLGRGLSLVEAKLKDKVFEYEALLIHVLSLVLQAMHVVVTILRYPLLNVASQRQHEIRH